MGGASEEIERLIAIMAELRTPGSGCPWDLDQDFASIARYTIEEAYEVLDAIERGDLDDLKDELGDLLLQVVFHARMAEERDAFAFADVCRAISSKMVRRHPHVFGTDDERDTPAEAVRANWEAIKAEERAARADRHAERRVSLLDDVPLALPALTRAVALQKRAAHVGFDWRDAGEVFDKLREETVELDEAVCSGDGSAISEEVGDLLFTVANLARHVGVDPESALRDANGKFARRFSRIERRAEEAGTDLDGTDMAVLEAWWRDAKAAERGGKDD